MPQPKLTTPSTNPGAVHNVVWAPFWSPRNNANYHAHNGAPAAYVGAKWDDSFTAACACP